MIVRQTTVDEKEVVVQFFDVENVTTRAFADRVLKKEFRIGPFQSKRMIQEMRDVIVDVCCEAYVQGVNAERERGRA